MRFDEVEQIFLEKDFKDRTVLNIITDNDIIDFVVQYKLRFLLEKIWSGKDANQVDGKLMHFSKTYYLLNHEPRSLSGSQLKIKDIIA